MNCYCNADIKTIDSGSCDLFLMFFQKIFSRETGKDLEFGGELNNKILGELLNDRGYE
jgi:hypothetical protein